MPNSGTTTRTVTIPAELSPVAVCGPEDQIIRVIERAYSELTFVIRGNTIAIVSSSARTEADALAAEDFLHEVIDTAYTNPLSVEDVQRLLANRLSQKADRKERKIKPAAPRFTGQDEGRPHFIGRPHVESAMGTSVSGTRSLVGSQRVPRVITMAHGVPVRAKTAGQVAYINAIESHTITFGIGPAGTGKTYLAVAKAVRAFEDGAVRRIILTRPAVEAGENLGFLPGTLTEKVDPYLRPLYDALSDMLGNERMQRYIADNTIEVAPLAYMRGRTLNDAYVILDEAQNTTPQQMKMFLTRLGFNTRMVITGDVTQVDFSVHRSGLRVIEDVLGDIEDIAFVHLGSDDVVRHSLVGTIVAAYDAYDEKAQKVEKVQKVEKTQSPTRQKVQKGERV
ncbi:phosphate starvation-inducible protein PhoH [Alloscardovia macacae]|uniref:PhoH-like protein n=1 Tax=Alloscardovia macacae TaxID=1160091 RepID=A0A1Y2SSU0_9BIFI|nr:PhoH family protein [Alloscardovia macacae]OTA25718.1 phosphate starvation-inducible protein PhoH [Alloscardovia macacae]OTA28331.1 phosphate starvation-inducible protein PhoH [Alloscardovia macacae]